MKSEQKRVCIRHQLIKATEGREVPAAVTERDYGILGGNPSVWELARLGALGQKAEPCGFRFLWATVPSSEAHNWAAGPGH